VKTFVNWVVFIKTFSYQIKRKSSGGGVALKNHKEPGKRQAHGASPEKEISGQDITTRHKISIELASCRVKRFQANS